MGVVRQASARLRELGTALPDTFSGSPWHQALPRPSAAQSCSGCSWLTGVFVATRRAYSYRRDRPARAPRSPPSEPRRRSVGHTPGRLLGAQTGRAGPRPAPGGPIPHRHAPHRHARSRPSRRPSAPWRPHQKNQPAPGAPARTRAAGTPTRRPPTSPPGAHTRRTSPHPAAQPHTPCRDADQPTVHLAAWRPRRKDSSAPGGSTGTPHAATPTHQPPTSPPHARARRTSPRPAYEPHP
ncbi:hypothetical protein SALBM135S_03527 [Streptomyces alboniger]